jgi:hypothetical protein
LLDVIPLSGLVLFWGVPAVKLRSTVLLAVVMCTSVIAKADVFYSGLVTVDGSVFTGGNSVPGANLFSGAVGTSYNNFWQTQPLALPGGVPNPAVFGSKSTALGYIGLTSAQTTGGTTGLATGSHGLTAVYALEGLVLPTSTGMLSNSFDPGDGNVPGGTLPGSVPGGVLRIYDRVPPHNANSIDPNSPNSWVPNPANLSEGLVAEVILTHRADNYLQGQPVAQTTLFQPNPIGGIENVNRFIIDTADAFGGFEGDLKLAFTNLFNVLGADADSLFKNLTVDPGVAGLVQTSLDIVANLDQEITSVNFPTLSQLTNLGAANALFDALLDAAFGPGSHLFAGNGTTDGPGSDLVFAPGNNPLFNGDSSVLNTSATAIPGGQFTTAPEPGTVAVWSLVALIGVATSLYMKKSGIKKAA